MAIPSERKSNRTIYSENREKYYDQVISMFESGMIAKEIVKVVPIGKSTVYRWYDEYISQNKNANIRKSPKEAAKTIRQLKSRISQLETLCAGNEDCVVFSKEYVKSLHDEIVHIVTDFENIAMRLSLLADKLTEGI